MIPDAPVPIIEAFVPAGHPNRPGTKLAPDRRGLVVHYTANFHPGATDTMHARYIARAYGYGHYRDPAAKTGLREGWIEAGSRRRFGHIVVGERFRPAGVHAFCDQDSITFTIPTDEVAWHCGDRPLPWDEVNRGQQPLARQVFGNRQNYHCLGVEICSNADWERAAVNALWLCARWCREFAIPSSMVFRHHDLTGKRCPAPFIEDEGAWERFRSAAARQ